MRGCNSEQRSKGFENLLVGCRWGPQPWARSGAGPGLLGTWKWGAGEQAKVLPNLCIAGARIATQVPSPASSMRH